MSSTAVERQIEARLKENDVRLTAGRLALVRSLGRADGPRSASDIYQALGHEVPLSSIYRTLAVLEEAGVVSPHYSTKGVARYELAEWLMGHHHHLVCVSCGMVEDIEIDADTESELSRIVDRVGSEISFRPSDHALEIEGVCGRCN